MVQQGGTKRAFRENHVVKQKEVYSTHHSLFSIYNSDSCRGCNSISGYIVELGRKGYLGFDNISYRADLSYSPVQSGQKHGESSV